MDKTLSLAILVGGIILLIIGINTSHSIDSNISRFFTDAPTDKAIWMLIGGAVVTIIGLMGLLRSSRN
ncbi:MAG: DUF3185 family protein [Sulfuricaulis sp.]